MKILKIEIRDNFKKPVRVLNFKAKGISYIYGNIDKPESNSETINSLGKTYALKFINYVFGANDEKTKTPSAICGYSIVAEVEKEGRKFNVEIVIREKELKRYINGEEYSVTEYKKFFGIDRSIYTTQIMLQQRPHEISKNSMKPSFEEYVAYLKLLKIDNILEDIEQIYKIQDQIKEMSLTKSQLTQNYQKEHEFKDKNIEMEVYLVDKEVAKLNDVIEEQKKLINDIQLTKIEEELKEKYKEMQETIQDNENEILSLEIEEDRLSKLIEISNKKDIGKKEIEILFQRAKFEIPELIKRRVEDVEKFNQLVYEDRKQQFQGHIEGLKQQIEDKQKKVEELKEKCADMEKIFAQNDIYKKAIVIISKKQKEREQLKYKEGTLSSIKVILKKTEEKEKELKEKFADCLIKLKENNEKIKRYRDFLYQITERLYKEIEIKSFFDLKINDAHKTRRPITIAISLTRDGGEGISEVKKNLIDLLVFKFNSELDFLIHDSACYNGIDPRQVAGVLKEIEKIANEVDKQAIVSINKYQVDDEQFEEYIMKNSAAILSENETLLGIRF